MAVAAEPAEIVVVGVRVAALEEAPDDPALQPASASIANSAAGATGRNRVDTTSGALR